jgi:RNA-binding protein YlmH
MSMEPREVTISERYNAPKNVHVSIVAHHKRATRRRLIFRRRLLLDR